MNSYLEQLMKSANANHNVTCFGLDPIMEALPNALKKYRDCEGLVCLFDKLFDEMDSRKVLPSAFKPNEGYWSVYDNPKGFDFNGSVALASVMDSIRLRFPEIPLILDNKRGDIAKSSDNYASEGFDGWGADAVTVHPYMGRDSVNPFIERNKGVYILDRTSNSGGKEMQNVIVKLNDRREMPYYEYVAERILDWRGENNGVGAVVGATSLTELEKLASFYKPHSLPILIPGVGGQGAKASDVMSTLRNCGYNLSVVRINSSSDITHPWVKSKESIPKDWASYCVDRLEKLIAETAI